MAVLSWLLRIVVFLLLLGLAARNSDFVTVRWFFGNEWRIELSALLLLLFCLGAMLGALAGWSFAHRGKRAASSSIQNPAAD
ncbi:MAG: DUF1049 domain-containing protein [Methyloversatilis sp.]|jgi:uncharacterized integral membrane protein|nr:DUF1049 domain-containing protein [Methyloversatilis sp.]MBP6194789.1 DUF1049 domain-containing protein [Methyloversatilis sp.]MBP9118791.1 DUF1049 domain-containing protein [Methyloversatilis sp.]